MYIPVFTNLKFVNNDGFLTDEMQTYNDELNQSLQNGLSDNGWTIAAVTATDIAKISPHMPDGTIWYDTTHKVWVGKQNGTLVKFTTAAYP